MSVVRFRLEAPNHAGVAQSVEQLICNQQVAGSSPISSSKSTLIENRFFSVYFYGRVPEWPKGADCKSASTAFGGSNPPPSTKKSPRRNAIFVLGFFVYKARLFILCFFAYKAQYLFWNILRIKFINLCRITQKYTEEPGTPKTIDELFAEGNEEYVDIVSDTLNDNLYEKIVSKIIVKNVEDVRDARWKIVSKAMKLRNTLNIYLKIKI